MPFHINPLQALAFRDRLNFDPSFRRCFSRDITKQFYAEMDNKDQLVLWIYGHTGSGKSAVAMEIARCKDPAFNAALIAFDNNELREIVARSQEGNSIIRDETVKDFGEGSNQMLSTIQDLTETLRKRRNSFFLLSPVIKGVAFVNYYLEILQSDVILEKKHIEQAIKDGLKQITFRVAVQTPDNVNLGYIIIKSPVNNPIYQDYVKMKDKFLIEMAAGDRTSGLDYIGEAEKILKELDLKEYSRKGERLNYIKQNTNFTGGQCRSIHIELERILRKAGITK